MNSKNLNSAQQQQLEEIGLKLNQVRTAKNISLETVSANTRITKRLLKAIEAGNSEELPEPFYIHALVAKFAQEIGATGIEFVSQSSTDTEVTEKTKNPHTERRYWLNFQLRSLHLYLLYILLIVVSVNIITSLVESPVIINQVPDGNSAVNSEVQESEATPQIKQPESLPQFVSQSKNSESVVVGINLQERCWLKVMVDGKLAFEGTLPKGTQRQWTGEKQVTIRAGNAGGVVITGDSTREVIILTETTISKIYSK